MQNFPSLSDAFIHTYTNTCIIIHDLSKVTTITTIQVGDSIVSLYGFSHPLNALLGLFVVLLFHPTSLFLSLSLSRQNLICQTHTQNGDARTYALSYTQWRNTSSSIFSLSFTPYSHRHPPRTHPCNTNTYIHSIALKKPIRMVRMCHSLCDSTKLSELQYCHQTCNYKFQIRERFLLNITKKNARFSESHTYLLCRLSPRFRIESLHWITPFIFYYRKSSTKRNLYSR